VASTGLKIAFGLVIGVTLTGALLSHVSAPPQPSTSVVTSGQVNESSPEPTPQQAAPAPRAASDNESAPDMKTASEDPVAVAQAKGTVAFIIGLNGYHCIKIINVQDATSGVYDVTCITDHHGHQATYMVNSATNDVAKI
jgi:hypothetical protein